MVQYFTKEGLQKIKEELVKLKTVTTKEVTKLISEAAAFGDLKENAAYHDARDKMSFLRMRIKELESAINEAVVRGKTDSDKIEAGSGVIILFDGKKENYRIVAPAESDILKNKISYQSPLGKVLIGKKTGEQFDFFAGDKKIKVKIVSIY